MRSEGLKAAVLAIFFCGIIFSSSIFLMAPRARNGNRVLTGSSKAHQSTVAGYGKFPLSFEPNIGQTHPAVKFIAKAPAYTMFLTGTEVVFAPKDGLEGTIRVEFVNSNPRPIAEGVDQQAGHENYFIGEDSSKWRTNIPLYNSVLMHDVYPGVDVLFYWREQQLEYDLVLQPGADPNQIKLRFEGAASIHVNEQGDLIVRNRTGEVIHRKPRIYQMIDGVRTPVSGGFVIARNDEVSFDVGPLRVDAQVVIDPIVTYSSYLGGSGEDAGFHVRVDREGAIYVMGTTTSLNFPTTPGAYAATPKNSVMGFITKLSPGGKSLVYSTYVSGNTAQDNFNGFAVDSLGSAYITGSTAGGIPVLNAYQSTLRGASDAFIAKLDPTGSRLVYSTYLGGSSTDGAAALAVDLSGNAYVTGFTSSSDFPLKNAYRSNPGHGFITKLNATGSALIFSTYFPDEISAMTIDGLENIYVAGVTGDPNFPVTAGVFQPQMTVNVGPGGMRPAPDAFVTKLNPSGSALVFSSFLGGGGSDGQYAEGIHAVAVDSSQNVYVAGWTESYNGFPEVGAPHGSDPCGAASGHDAFFTKIDNSGSRLIYSWCEARSGGLNEAMAVVVDSSQNAYFTTINFVDPDLGFMIYKLSPIGGIVATQQLKGTMAPDQTFWNIRDVPYDLALGTGSTAYVTGQTFSTDFPVVNPYRGAYGGKGDAFISRIDFSAQRFEETSSAILYSGTWYNNASPQTHHSSGSAKLALGAGARATFTFSGAGARWIAYRDQYSGIAKVYVDGVFQQEIDTYASPGQAQAIMFTTPALAAGTHTLTVEVTGRKNPAALSAWVWVDAFDTTSSTSNTGIFSRVEQTNPAVTKAGTWYTVNSSIFSAGSAVEALSAGARVTFTFNGTAAKWIGFKDRYSGVAKVYVDGSLQTQIDTYGATQQAQTVLYTTPTLPPGTHTLTVEVAGTHNAASSSNWVWIDAFESSSGGPGSGGTVSFTRAEQSNSAVTYSGTWYGVNNGIFSGGSASEGLGTGARATLTFNGTAAKWIGFKDRYSGIAKVYVDGVLQTQVDTYSAIQQAQAVLFATTGLTPGAHTLVIEATGTKNASASSAWVWVDAFEFAP